MHHGVGIYSFGVNGGGSTTDSDLGKIIIYDPQGSIFTSLEAGIAYLEGFTDGEIKNPAYSENTFYFDVDEGTFFDVQDGFLSDFEGIFLDEFSLIRLYANNAFYNFQGTVKIGHCFFNGYAFYGFQGKAEIGDCDFASEAFGNSICELKAGDFICASNPFMGSSGDWEIASFSGNNNCFMNSTGNLKCGAFSCNLNGFDAAHPTKQNEIQRLVFCQQFFCKDYTGRMVFTGAVTEVADTVLSADMFTTANLVSLHYPVSEDFSNAGGQNANLITMIGNISNINSLITNF